MRCKSRSAVEWNSIYSEGDDGARGRSRTDTLLRAADFESAASTNSATRALRAMLPALSYRFRPAILNRERFLPRGGRMAILPFGPKVGAADYSRPPATFQVFDASK